MNARIEEGLEHELAGVNHRISVLKQRASPEEWQGGGDNTPLSEGADAKQAMEERDSESEQVARLLERAAVLARAIRRIQAGTYGTCDRCGQAIDPRRLRALPETPYCLDCEERLEALLLET